MQVIFFSLLLFWLYCSNKYLTILQIRLLVVYLDPNLVTICVVLHMTTLEHTKYVDGDDDDVVMVVVVVVAAAAAAV